MPVFRHLALPFCQVLMVEEWNAPPHRFFAAYRALGSYRWLLGHAVVDEFATFSSPLFLAPRALLGKIYDAGITLGHRRDPEMAVDLGWPPLCAGLDEPAPELQADWEEQLLAALRERAAGGSEEASPPGVRTARVGAHELQRLRASGVTVLATSAPLLPRQLGRLCEIGSDPLTVAFATGNRITRSSDGSPQTVQVLSEARLAELLKAARAL